MSRTTPTESPGNVQPKRCWACGYDTSACISEVCPECGQLASAEPPKHRVRHSPGAFTSIIAFVTLCMVGLVYLLVHSTNGTTRPPLGPTIAITATAVVNGANILRLFFAAPVGVDERTTAKTSFWIAAISAIAVVAVFI